VDSRSLGEAALGALFGAAAFLAALYFRSDIASYIGETLTNGLMFGLFFLFCGLPALELLDGWRFVRNSERHKREQEAEDKRQQTEREREEQDQKAEFPGVLRTARPPRAYDKEVAQPSGPPDLARLYGRGWNGLRAGRSW
jgi:hypothetical protein